MLIVLAVNEFLQKTVCLISHVAKALTQRQVIQGLKRFIFKIICIICLGGVKMNWSSHILQRSSILNASNVIPWEEETLQTKLRWGSWGKPSQSQPKQVGLNFIWSCLAAKTMKDHYQHQNYLDLKQWKQWQMGGWMGVPCHFCTNKVKKPGSTV